MSEISPSALGEQFDADFQAKLDACTTPAQIKDLLHSRELSSGLIQLDWDPAIRIPVEPGTAPRKFAQTITDAAGKKVIFEGDSELDVTRQANEYMRGHFSQPTATTQQPEQARDAAGRFTAQQTVTDQEKQALSLQLSLGQIDMATYLEKSGAVDEYLTKRGVPLDALREQVAEKQLGQVQQSWSDATQEFLNSSAGADWPGGATNLATAARILGENGLTDSPSAETLAEVWKFMKDNNLAVANPELEARDRIARAQSPDELRQALGYRGTTGLWGR